MSAPFLQDQLQAQSTQDDDESGPGVMSLIAICIAVLSLGLTLGVAVTRAHYTGTIAEYQNSLDEATTALRDANNMMYLQPQPTPPSTTHRPKPTSARMQPAKEPYQDPANNGNAGNGGGKNQDPPPAPASNPLQPPPNGSRNNPTPPPEPAYTN